MISYLKNSKLKKKKEKTLKRLKKDLDDVFALWIKNRDNWTCITCGKYDPGSRHMHAGHFVLRRHMSTRWNEKNVSAQCAGCNTFQYGAMDVYALKLQEKYGEGILKELNQLKQKEKHWQRSELESLIKKYG